MTHALPTLSRPVIQVKSLGLVLLEAKNEKPLVDLWENFQNQKRTAENEPSHVFTSINFIPPRVNFPISNSTTRKSLVDALTFSLMHVARKSKVDIDFVK